MKRREASSAPIGVPEPETELAKDLQVERYKYILQQLNSVNENVHRVLALYQSLGAAITGAGLALFVGYRKWEIATDVARAGLTGLAWLLTVVAAFTVLLVASSVMSWIDYRREECELLDKLVGHGFRERPRPSNFYRWHETWIVGFIICSSALVWLLLLQFAIPNLK